MGDLLNRLFQHSAYLLPFLTEQKPLDSRLGYLILSLGADFLKVWWLEFIIRRSNPLNHVAPLTLTPFADEIKLDIFEADTYITLRNSPDERDQKECRNKIKVKYYRRRQKLATRITYIYEMHKTRSVFDCHGCSVSACCEECSAGTGLRDDEGL